MNTNKRMRGRKHRGPGGGGGAGGAPRHNGGGGVPLNRNHVFDSNGPDLRIRGTAQQLFERYLQLGRDATTGGDRVMAESYFQHAEHYFRILNAMAQAQGQPQQNGGQQNGQHYQSRRPGMENGMGEGMGEGGDDDEMPLPGLGDQPGADAEGGEAADARQIPIAASPPEG
jgi:hypothetical protein